MKYSRLQLNAARQARVLPALVDPDELDVQGLGAHRVRHHARGQGVDKVFGQGAEDVDGGDVEDLGLAVCFFKIRRQEIVVREDWGIGVCLGWGVKKGQDIGKEFMR